MKTHLLPFPRFESVIHRLASDWLETMRILSPFREFLLFSLIQSVFSSDFEYARIIGNPKLECGEKSVLVQIETSVPFQGRIYVVDKPDLPSCSASFYSNLSPNASILMDFRKCLDEFKSTNNSRIFGAYVAIGFHPLVMTTADRMFSVKCIDETRDQLMETKQNLSCSHLVRQATRWNLSSPRFHLGDSIVHDWSCTFSREEEGKFLGVLTFCNAVSQSGKILHLIDENGCIVDSELLGDLSYSHYQIKIYGRAKLFRFVTGEKMRFECKLQMCRRGVGGCNSSLIPPKCSFTKEEIIKRHEARKARLSLPSDEFRTNLLTETVDFEREIDVISDWITVHHNEYTDVENLRERYLLSAPINHSLQEIKESTTERPFLMDMSFRDELNKTPWTTISPNIRSVQIEGHSVKRIPKMMRIDSLDFDKIDELHPDFNLFQSPDGRMKQFELTTGSGAPSTSSSTPVTSTRTPSGTRKTTRRIFFTSRPPYQNTIKSLTETNLGRPTMTKQHDKWPSNADFELGFEATKKESTNGRRLSGESFSLSPPPPPPPPSPLPFDFIPKITTTTRRPPLKVVYRPNQPESNDNDLELMDLNTGEPPFEEMSSQEMGKAPPFDINDIQGQFENHRKQWRLDDSKGDNDLNDTSDPFRSTEAQCANGTAVMSANRCKWSSINDILLMWSFGSVVAWLILAAVFFYKHNKRKPDWARRCQTVSTPCVIHAEHPWTHRDAFVEGRKQPTFNKKDIDLPRL